MEKHDKENIARANEPGRQPDPFQPQGPRDGLDNTGTQGYDSLKDDWYKGEDKEDHEEDNKDGSGNAGTP